MTAPLSPSSASSSAPAELEGAPGRYSGVARVLHWLVAGAIVLQFLLGERAEEAAADNALLLQLVTLAQHKSIGITVLALVLLRLLWRGIRGTPALPLSYQTTHPTLARLSGWMHAALYLLLLFMPLSGWLMSSASAYSVSWFGLVQLPDLIAPSEASKALLQNAHHWAAKALLVLALLHIAAALKHLLIDKDGMIRRMTDRVAVILFGLTVAIGVWLTFPDSNVDSMPVTAVTATPTAPLTEEVADGAEVAEVPAQPIAPVIATPPAWRIDTARSQIRFQAQQAGAEFTGQWQRFEADIQFDPARIENSRALVRIDATSVATQDAERDTTLAGGDWFDSGQFAEVVFTATEFTQRADGFSTQARLAIRGVEYPVEFLFAVERSEEEWVLTGTAKLDRLALGLGTVEWADTEWVGQFVTVEVEVVGKPGESAGQI